MTSLLQAGVESLAGNIEKMISKIGSLAIFKKHITLGVRKMPHLK